LAGHGGQLQEPDTPNPSGRGAFKRSEERLPTAYSRRLRGDQPPQILTESLSADKFQQLKNGLAHNHQQQAPMQGGAVAEFSQIQQQNQLINAL